MLIAGYGRTGELLGQSLDRAGPALRRPGQVVGADRRPGAGLVPRRRARAWPPTSRDPGHLAVAGLDHPWCEAVVALTDDEEANLAVVMAAALLRPDMPVIARVTSRDASPSACRRSAIRALVNPFDRFGDHLRLALQGARLLPAADLAGERPGGRAARPRAAAADRSLGRLRLRPARPGADRRPARRGPRGDRHRARTRTDGEDDATCSWATAPIPWVMAQADLDRAVGFVAGTDNDTTNLSLVAAARRSQPAAVRRRAAEPGGERAAVRRHARRRAARAHAR